MHRLKARLETLTPRGWARIVLVVIALVVLITGPRVERLGDRYQIALPIVALGCSIANGSGPEYLLRYGVLWVGIHGPKNALGAASFNMRPNGSDAGMPSGHTATAVFGASTLVSDCVGDSLPAKAATLIAAGFTGASRIDAHAHTIWQVLAGAIWGVICDRALRQRGPARVAVRDWLRRRGQGVRSLFTQRR